MLSLFGFWAHRRYAATGLSAPIATQFPLQSLARLPRELIVHALSKARDKAAGGPLREEWASGRRLAIGLGEQADRRMSNEQ
jgi:hypothetical protein